jgi:hypothetical protein
MESHVIFLVIWWNVYKTVAVIVLIQAASSSEKSGLGGGLV